MVMTRKHWREILLKAFAIIGGKFLLLVIFGIGVVITTLYFFDIVDFVVK